MELQANDIYALLEQWHDKELSEEKMTEQLRARGLDDERTREMIASYRKHRADSRQRTGFILAAVGSLFCFISCILTLLNPLPEWRELILYGITSLGVLVIFAGFYYIFEP